MKINLWLLLLALCWACSGQDPIETAPEHIPAGMQYIAGGAYTRSSLPGGHSTLEIKGFLLDKHPVTVADFRKFVQASGYETDAEKFGSAGVFALDKGTWILVKGACWEYPLGKDKAGAADDHPVTQVSWNDAMAYCKWAGKRLPTEYEWEYAARSNGKVSTRYSWGNELTINGAFQANVWQGQFPLENTAADGYLYTAPVGLFGKTGHGLSDMGGNVWQWTADNYVEEGLGEIADAGNWPEKLLKGGSFMCDASFCHNYLVEGRTYSSRETALFHTGFRCARSL